MQHKARFTIPYPNPHPLRERLRKHHLSLWQLAQVCGISSNYLSQQLVGTKPMNPDVESKLEDLLEQLEQESDTDAE